MSDDPLLIVYDGDCPFCAAYVRMLRLRAAVGPVTLVNAREAHPVVAMLGARGFDLDQGMALVRGFASGAPEVAYGEDCVHQIALMTTQSGLVNRATAAMLRSPRRARALYPVLRAGRNMALRLLGRRKINDRKGHAGDAPDRLRRTP